MTTRTNDSLTVRGTSAAVVARTKEVAVKFEDMTPKQQREYLNEHPNSKSVPAQKQTAVSQNQKKTINKLVSVLQKIGFKFDKQMVRTKPSYLVTLFASNSLAGSSSRVRAALEEAGFWCSYDINVALEDTARYVSFQVDHPDIAYLTIDELHGSVYIQTVD